MTTPMSAGTTWKYLSGDTAAFAFEVTLSRDDVDDSMVDPDERASWGSFAVWARGRNVCAHLTGGETLQHVHWYLLPLLEWIADGWDALLHEERLPVSNEGADAAAGLRRAEPRALSVTPGDEREWMREWQDWWSRHNWRAAAEGGVFPDLHLRRWGDQIEISVGSEPAHEAPVRFVVERTTQYAPAEAVAEALHEVLTRTAEELSKRHPASERLKRLLDRSMALRDGRRYRQRFAWLSGAHSWEPEVFDRVWPMVSQFSSPEAQQREVIVAGSPAPALLFGSYAPDIDEADALALIEAALAHQRQPAGEVQLITVDPLSLVDSRGMSAGEAGSALGDACYEALGLRGPPVAVETFLDEHGVRPGHISLRDPRVRAVSLLMDGRSPSVLVNERFQYGTHAHVVRFSLAHELGHLLLDRDRARSFALTSGPWAPRGVEQRANAFAAALLMPSRLLHAEIARLSQPLDDTGSIQALAGTFAVGASSLIDRLYNLALLDQDQWLRLRQS